MRLNKIQLFLLILTFSAPLIAQDQCDIQEDGSNEVVGFSDEICTICAYGIENTLADEKKRFDKVYSKKDTQEPLVNKAAYVNAKADENTFKLWNSSMGYTLANYIKKENGKVVYDPIMLELIKDSYKNIKHDQTAISHLDSNYGYYVKNEKNYDDEYIFPQGATARVLHTVLNNPKYESLKLELQSSVKDALSSLPNNTFAESDITLSQDRVMQMQQDNQGDYLISYGDQKKIWSDKLESENDFEDPNSDAYQKNFLAYQTYREELIQKYEEKAQRDYYQKNPKKMKELKKKASKEIASIHFNNPSVVKFTPPQGVNVNEFYQKVVAENPSYHNCQVSYSANKAVNKNIVETAQTPAKDDEVNPSETQVMPPMQAKTCNLETNFADDQYQLPDNMNSEIQTCLSDIPENALNVKIEIESCASTVRTNKAEYNKSNLILSKKRTGSIASLIPQDKGYEIKQNYQGTNKMINDEGNLAPTGTCGPWVKGIGDYQMDPSQCIDKLKVATNFCDSTPEYMIKNQGLYWVCNQRQGIPYTQDLKEELKKYRYNKIKISYELPPTKVPDRTVATFDPTLLEEEEKLQYIESMPHISCLYPRLTHSRYKSFKDRQKDAWRDFQVWASSISFNMPSVGGGTSSGGGGHVGLCAAYQ